jgi:AraC family transcriptional activator of pobA
MNETGTHTLVNPQNGNLAFKIFGFESVCHFNHIKRLGYYSMLLIQSGNGKLKAEASERCHRGTFQIKAHGQ